MITPLDAWFTPTEASFFSFISLLSLLSLLERYAERGQYRFAVLGACTVAVAVGAALLLAATVAYTQSQR